MWGDQAQPIEVVGLDGDDTLWRCEDLFQEAQAQFRALLTDFADDALVDETLSRVERGNLALFGYGIKGFALSAVETAARLAGPELHARLVEQILDLARGMLSAPVELLPGAGEAVWALRDLGHRVVLVTKGDLLDQERKLQKSGLADAFDHVEIISEKSVAKYAELLRVLDCPPERFLMVGNSVRSDIVPVIELGARAVHVPYHLVWDHEHVGSWDGHDNVVEIANLSELPALLSSTAAAQGT
ncbi:MAG: putative hydrolase of the superfamily [Frankiales bacterium]|nr:putative hydrolase of the superfamily [Frankiales bacterium]MDX6211031.1 putative hydrolase of the superfamily [Frankiales bacterium]